MTTSRRGPPDDSADTETSRLSGTQQQTLARHVHDEEGRQEFKKWGFSSYAPENCEMVVFKPSTVSGTEDLGEAFPDTSPGRFEIIFMCVAIGLTALVGAVALPVKRWAPQRFHRPNDFLVIIKVSIGAASLRFAVRAR